MSLSSAQQEATSNELNANFDLSALTPDEICVDLGISRSHLDEIFSVTRVAPSDVSMLRDYLDAAIVERGLTPLPYSSMTPATRNPAKRWFPR
jgi:hypothetical protein